MTRTLWLRRFSSVAVCSLLSACEVGETRDEPNSATEIHDERNIELWGREYLDSLSFRRGILEQSLNFQENGYARLRLNEYGVSQNGSDAGWELLPEFAPLVRLFIPDQGFGIPFEPVPLLAADWTRADLYTLGQWAFERYPVQLDGASELLLRQNEDLTWWGMTRDDEGQVGGLVEVQLPSGGTALGMTCATCHGDVVDGSAVDGRAVAGLDRGRLMADAAVGGGAGEGPASAAWGAGRVDVTADGVSNPQAIPDLRAIRYQRHLNATGGVTNSLPALAVRIETLIITSHGGQVRPPRAVSLALAWYLWNLEPAARGSSPGTPEQQQAGRAVFDRECARCHGDGVTSVGLVPMSDVGTDTRAGESTERGTGMWRVPSLVGVSGRSQWFHTGVSTDLAGLFQASRLLMEPGHAFGTTLNAAEKASLLMWLEQL
jgi:mono/diheme cytochrome c family protein